MWILLSRVFRPVLGHSHPFIARTAFSCSQRHRPRWYWIHSLRTELPQRSTRRPGLPRARAEASVQQLQEKQCHIKGSPKQAEPVEVFDTINREAEQLRGEQLVWAREAGKRWPLQGVQRLERQQLKRLGAFQRPPRQSHQEEIQAMPALMTETIQWRPRLGQMNIRVFTAASRSNGLWLDFWQTLVTCRHPVLIFEETCARLRRLELEPRIYCFWKAGKTFLRYLPHSVGGTATL